MKKIKPATIALIIILVAYTIISFYKLGNMKNPQTYVNLKDNEQLTFRIDSDQIPKKMMIYSANDESNVSIFFVNEYKTYDKYEYDTYFEINYANLFKWNEIYFNTKSCDYKYIMFESNVDTTALGEIKIYDENGKEITITAMDEKGKELLDEQSLVPEEYSYMNSTYFDEVYFPRTSYEILNKLPIYEYTHPPLGKLIISIPVHFLGLTPFAYRLCGNIAGILMILVIYLIAKQLFKRDRYALFSALIMALDGMHFVQTRIGTVDSLLLLFCLTSFYFFLRFLKIPAEENWKKKRLPLLLSGTFWGMAIATKWTSAFIGAGMGIIYLAKMIKSKRFDIKLILWSIVSFVIIPLTIYVASYIPIMMNPNAKLYYEHEDKNGEKICEYVQITDVKSFIKYQQAMYHYHSTLKASHPYTSKWYEWPIMKRPLWFYISRFDNNTIGTIACMGNPAIWWLSMITAIYTLTYTIITRNKEGAILIVMIAITWFTYALIGRIMFIYHYFITLPFMMLTIPFAVSKLAEWKPKIDYIMPVLTLIFLGTFIYFYPIYSGKPVSIEYVKKTEWLNSWEYDGLAH